MSPGADILKRAWIPVLRYFEALKRPDPERQGAAFLAWLEAHDLPSQLDLTIGSVREHLRGLLGLFAESTLGLLRSETAPAAEAFEGVWWSGVRERALELAKARLIARRRIVPFLVFQRRAESPATVAAQLGLAESDVRDYVQEVEDGIRSAIQEELERDGEAPAAASAL